MKPQWRKTKANKRRAESGLSLAKVSADNNDGIPETEDNLVDAVTDTLHYAASQGIDTSAVLRRSMNYFDIERTGRNV